MTNHQLIFTCRNGTGIFVERGSKSKRDFIVKYREVGRRLRTPKHIHWTIDLMLKNIKSPNLGKKLVRHLIKIAKHVKSTRSFPPKIHFFQKRFLKKFKQLEKYGEYPIDFLLVIVELILIQEKTNYPDGTATIELLNEILSGKDIFSIVSMATFRGF